MSSDNFRISVVAVLMMGLLSSVAEALPIHKFPELLSIGLNNTAKEFCSCVFVSEGTKESCVDYARITQFPVQFSVNPKKKTVRTRAFVNVWPLPSATAEFVSESVGCRVQTISPAQH
jgi:hypothetical protein